MTDPTPHAKRASTTTSPAQASGDPAGTAGAEQSASARTPRPDHAATTARVADTAPDRSAAVLLRRLPVYQQIAEDLRARITSGEFPPGGRLPSETDLIGRYGASRITVRNAVAELRAAGLVDTAHGRATTVRALAQATALDLAITRHGKAFLAWDDEWTDSETPARYRSSAGRHSASLAIHPDEPVFVCERRLTHPDGAAVIHQLVIPFAVVDKTPGLQDDPFPRPGNLYTAIAAAGHIPQWADTITAAMPNPDQAATLAIPDGVPLITHTRTTANSYAQPLAVEHTHIPAHRITLASTPHTVTTSRPRKAGPPTTRR